MELLQTLLESIKVRCRQAAREMQLKLRLQGSTGLFEQPVTRERERHDREHALTGDPAHAPIAQSGNPASRFKVRNPQRIGDLIL